MAPGSCVTDHCPHRVLLPTSYFFLSLQEVTSRTFMPISECPSARCRTNNAKGRLCLQVRGSKFTKFQEVKWKSMPVRFGPSSFQFFNQVHSMLICVVHWAKSRHVSLVGQNSGASWACPQGTHSSFYDCPHPGRTHPTGLLQSPPTGFWWFIVH